MAVNTELNALKEHCLSCTGCRLCENRTNVVFGVGNDEARILFVGEGPGENEDLQGEPFVGKAGRLLDDYLGAVGFDRKSNIYIANIVKCRPPHNRDPLPDEQDMCIRYLREQFRILKPAIVVCLGRIAACRLIKPDFRVTREHGEFFDKKGTLFVGTFHPAALLRNPENREDALKDFLAVRQKAEEMGII